MKNISKITVILFIFMTTTVDYEAIEKFKAFSKEFLAWLDTVDPEMKKFLKIPLERKDLDFTLERKSDRIEFIVYTK